MSRWPKVGSSRGLDKREHGPRRDGFSVQLPPAAEERGGPAEAAAEKGQGSRCVP